MNGPVVQAAPAAPEIRPVRRAPGGPRRKTGEPGVVVVRKRKRSLGASVRRRGAGAGARLGKRSAGRRGPASGAAVPGRSGGRRRRRFAGKRLDVRFRRRLPAHADGAGAAEAGRSSASVEEALERGRYEGGELLLEQAVPAGFSLGDLTLQDVIAAGVDALRPRLLPLIDAAGVFHELEAALAEGRPLSVVRLGDGELLALAHDTVYEAAVVRREAPFLAGAGMAVPDHDARGRLAAAVRQASIVGVPLSRRRHYGPLLGPALAANGIDIRSLRLTESTINYSLYQTGLLARLLQGRRMLVIGNAAPGLAARLAQAGFAVTGVISPVRGFPDIDRVIGEAAAARESFDLALVASGIPAVVIAARLAAELGKAALDFGHLADHIASRPPGEI